MRFAKWHGSHNDFVMLADPDDAIELTAPRARALCDRRAGVGADGVIRVAPGRDGADVTMDYRNADGSHAEMCGNGIRCVALFARAEGLGAGPRMSVATGAGVRDVTILESGDVRVDMGVPDFEPARVPVEWDGADALRVELELDDALRVDLGLDDAVVEASCLSMGNPHAVVFVDDVAAVALRAIGPALERHRRFPHGANVEVARVESPERVAMRVWERGSGETHACGTGACAVAVAARTLRGVGARVVVAQPGGDVVVEWSGLGSPAYLIGPAIESYRGDVDLDGLAAAVAR